MLLASPPVLDGNKGASTGCTTAACDGPVLTVPSGEDVALTGLTIANGNNTASFGSGGLDNAGTVTITGSTFAGNSATWDGGAIDNADNQGNGSVTVTGSTFTGNTARLGGAIASGEWGGFGTATVSASTFTGNTTKIGGGNGLGGYGGAISIGYGGNGTATVTASTFSGNTAQAAGGAIASGGNGGGGTMTVAGDLFNGSCTQGVGPWTDDGYNAGTDKTCFASTPATGDKSGSAVGSDLQTGLTGNGGPTKTIAPTTGNPAIGLIPNPATITLGSHQVALCPATDQRGYPSAASTACDAGAVQTSGWPAQVTGTHVPAAHAAEGYRLGVAGNTWKLYVTHPGTTKVSFTGKVSVPAGTLGHLSLINPTTGHQVSNTGKAITFTLPDSGTVTGFSFTTSTQVAKITFTLGIGGHPATPSQLFLGGTAAHPASGSPLTFTR